MTILRLPEIKSKLGLGRSTIYSQQVRGSSLRAFGSARGAVGWLEGEGDAVLHARILGNGDAVIRELVVALVAARRIGSSVGPGSRPTEPEHRPENWLNDPPSTPLTEPEMRFIDWLCDRGLKEWIASQVPQRRELPARPSPATP